MVRPRTGIARNRRTRAGIVSSGQAAGDAVKLRSRFGALWNRPSRPRRKFLTFLQEIQSLLRHDIHLVMDRPGTVVSPGTCRPLVSAVAQVSCKTSGWRTPTAFTAQVSDVLVIKFGGPIDGFLLSELPRAMASFAPVIGSSYLNQRLPLVSLVKV